jgi:hypothetical protein
MADYQFIPTAKELLKQRRKEIEEEEKSNVPDRLIMRRYWLCVISLRLVTFVRDRLRCKEKFWCKDAVVVFHASEFEEPGELFNLLEDDEFEWLREELGKRGYLVEAREMSDVFIDDVSFNVRFLISANMEEDSYVFVYSSENTHTHTQQTRVMP